MSPRQAYLFKHRSRLPALINDVWQWEFVDDALSDAKESRVAALSRAAATECICNGAWLSAVVGSFMANTIDPRAL
eukprot:7416125-Karenia_brevis.AAC.1